MQQYNTEEIECMILWLNSISLPAIHSLSELNEARVSKLLLEMYVLEVTSMIHLLTSALEMIYSLQN